MSSLLRLSLLPFRRFRRGFALEDNFKEGKMPLYEHIFLARQDISAQQVTALVEEYEGIVKNLGGGFERTESWGLRTLAFKIRKNRKAHYTLIQINAPHTAVAEMERQMRINESVIRYLTLKVDKFDENPSIMMQKRDRDEKRRREREERVTHTTPTLVSNEDSDSTELGDSTLPTDLDQMSGEFEDFDSQPPTNQFESYDNNESFDSAIEPEPLTSSNVAASSDLKQSTDQLEPKDNVEPTESTMKTEQPTASDSAETVKSEQSKVQTKPTEDGESTNSKTLPEENTETKKEGAAND